MSGEFDGLAKCVNDPAEDEFSGGPTAVALQQLLERDGLISVGFVELGLSQDVVYRFQQVVSQRAHAGCSPLSQLDEVVNEHVRQSHWSL